MKQSDPVRRRRLMLAIMLAVVVAIAIPFAFSIFHYRAEKSVVNAFLKAIEARNFEKAYAIYQADPDWKQHPEKHGDYSYSQFVLDWGPNGDYGPITAHHIECLAPRSDRTAAAGVIVVVRINNRVGATPSLWVDKKTKAISISPAKGPCGDAE